MCVDINILCITMYITSLKEPLNIKLLARISDCFESLVQILREVSVELRTRDWHEEVEGESQLG